MLRNFGKHSFVMRRDRSFRVVVACAAFAINIGFGQEGTVETPAKSPGVGPNLQLPREFKPDAAVANKNHDDRSYVFAWHLFTSVGDYELVGSRDRRWDSSATNGLRAYAEIQSVQSSSARSDELRLEIAKSLKAAVEQGCDDPLVRYVHARYVLSTQDEMTDALISEKYAEAAKAMEKNRYSPVRKAYAYVRAAESLKASLGRSTNKPPALTDYLIQAAFHLDEALHDQMMPPDLAEEICWQALEVCEGNKAAHEFFDERVIATLEKFWSKHAFTFAVKGELNLKLAWDWRGNGFANTVTKAGWEGFQQKIIVAEKALQEAWRMDQSNVKTPTAMIWVCTAQGYARPKMERWFNRAMNIDSNCWAAADAKAWYLEPRWHGSTEEVLEFGRECAASAKWAGRVPLVLADIHWRLASYLAYGDKEKRVLYFKDPKVWQDLRSSYEKFFELTPNDVSTRNYYARDAFNCGQYQVFVDQVALVGNQLTPSIFGGKEKFDNLLRIARENLAAPKSDKSR